MTHNPPGVERIDVIVVGHLRWNRYFGESAERPPRGHPSTCTSTLIRGRDAAGNPYALLVDPTWRATPSDYCFDLNRRTGLHKTDITHVFITHHHQDHVVGAGYFPEATWCAAAGVIEALRDADDIDAGRIQPVAGELVPGLSVQHLPGHTETIHGLMADYQGRRWAIAADAAFTADHVAHETTEFQWDADVAAESIRWLVAEADVIVPGHDNIIINGR